MGTRFPGKGVRVEQEQERRPRKRRAFTPEYKAEVVELCRTSGFFDLIDRLQRGGEVLYGNDGPTCPIPEVLRCDLAGGVRR